MVSTTTYTLHITFSSAQNLPVADIPSFSSDPYIISTLRFPPRGNLVPKLHHRTRTLRRTLEPKWEHTWSVANVPASGAEIKVKVMDEDMGDHDDTLGVANIETGALSGRATKSYKEGLSLRKGRGKWIALARLITVGCGQGKWSGLGGDVLLTIRIEETPPISEKSEDQWSIDRPYTIGPNAWTQHFSRLIGIITHTTSAGSAGNSTASTPNPDGDVQHYTFAATKIQLSGPLPPELYHQYVAFRPIIKTFYTKAGIRGQLLNRALKHQYRTIYSYNKSTSYGTVGLEHDGMAKRFLDLTHWGAGGRVYTYVITLDAEWRFTETGKEFGIQMLSKHTMHSCVSIHVGFAGEFFVRGSSDHEHHREGHVHEFELVIDNDSGTYRPPKENLPMLHKFLQKNLHGLKVTVKDAFEDGHQDEKKAHAQEKERSGRRRFKQPSNSRSSSVDNTGSISSSDEEELRDGHLGVGRRIKRKAWEAVQKEHEMDNNSKEDKGKAIATENTPPIAGASK